MRAYRGDSSLRNDYRSLTKTVSSPHAQFGDTAMLIVMRPYHVSHHSASKKPPENPLCEEKNLAGDQVNLMGEAQAFP